MQRRRERGDNPGVVGLLPKILLDLIEATAGTAAVEKTRKRAGLPPDQRFRLDAVYPDDEWQRLLAAACDVLCLTQEQVEAAFAEFFGRDALQRWPVWFRTSANARKFLERQPTIHNTLVTGLRDAAARVGIEDKFRVESRENELVTHYRSPNRLCGLYMALAGWALRHYGERASIDQPRCAKRGDEECEIHVRWEPTGASS